MFTSTTSSEKVSKANDINASVANTEYYLSDVYEKLGYHSLEELEASLTDTFEALYSSKISVKQNFKQVFRFNDGKMYTDWKISPLAYNFLKLNPVH